jgi:hypothetical protein
MYRNSYSVTEIMKYDYKNVNFSYIYVNRGEKQILLTFLQIFFKLSCILALV